MIAATCSPAGKTVVLTLPVGWPGLDPPARNAMLPCRASSWRKEERSGHRLPSQRGDSDFKEQDLGMGTAIPANPRSTPESGKETHREES